MERQMLVFGLGLFLTTSLCATQPATTRATTATGPVIDPAVMKILRDLDAAGEKHTTIRADLTLRIVERLTGDSEERTGWVVYQRAQDKTPVGFRIHFGTLRLGAGKTRKEKLDHAFDGHFWTVVKHSIKDVVRYQLAGEGEEIEPMRVGKGMFPLPFGQSTDDVLKYYTATTRPVRKNEPKDTVYLKLTARRDRYKDVDLTRVEMWIDRKTHLPVRLFSKDKKKKASTVTFTNMQTNVKIDRERMFHIPRPAGYTYKVERLNK